MLKPPAANIPGMTDTLDFVKKLWGSMNIPGAGMPGMTGLSGMASPALTTEDLDKKIADLKAVEAWLNMNLSMLRGTIHALEVQRATLGTLKSMGASMAEAMRQSGVSAEKMANMPFAPFFGQPTQAAAPDAKPATPAARPAATPPAGAKPDAPPPTPGAASAQPGTAAPQGAATEIPNAAAAMPAALAWWNMLQEQFTQAVANAMTPPPAPEAAPAAKPGAPRAGGNGPASGNGKARSRSRSDKSQ
jgi:hypothetical protein